jgi:hypothetical protein
MLRSFFIVGLLICVTSAHAQESAQDAKAFVAFVQEFEATCVSREAVQILIKNTHPTNKIRVWLDRYHMGVGTGDRSKTDLKVAAEPEPLGCSRTLSGPQEWRVVRAEFIRQ